MQNLRLSKPVGDLTVTACTSYTQSMIITHTDGEWFPALSLCLHSKYLTFHPSKCSTETTQCNAETIVNNQQVGQILCLTSFSK